MFNYCHYDICCLTYILFISFFLDDPDLPCATNNVAEVQPRTDFGNISLNQVELREELFDWTKKLEQRILEQTSNVGDLMEIMINLTQEKG